MPFDWFAGNLQFQIHQVVYGSSRSVFSWNPLWIQQRQRSWPDRKAHCCVKNLARCIGGIYFQMDGAILTNGSARQRNEQQRRDKSGKDFHKPVLTRRSFYSIRTSHLKQLENLL